MREVLLLTKYLSAKKTAELLGMNASYVSQIQQGRYWSPTGEIKGPRNFPKGDPRNPAFRSGRRKTAHEDLTFFQSIVPHGTPGRDDIIAEMYLAYFEGRVTRADLKKRDFVNAFYKKNFEQGGYAVAFDDVAFAIENNRSG